MFRYFAYGSVLSLSHAREWCASHALDPAPFLRGERARLDGWRLMFDVPSRFWSGLVANLEPRAGAHVEGVLFDLDDSAREAVLRKEGVATGLYRELLVPVEAGAGRVEASVFVARDERRASAGPASARYLEALLEGARDRGLSAEWIRWLESLTRSEERPPPPGVPLGLGR